MTPEHRDAPLRILVVDDNPAIHDDFRKILLAPPTGTPKLDALEASLFPDEARPAPIQRAQRFEIDSAHQGERALELVRHALEEGRPYALAFVDGRMPPGPSGIETVAELWKLDARLQVVLCTAYSDHTWSDIVRVLGQSDNLLVLRKPFDAIEALQMAHAFGRKWLLSVEQQGRLLDLEEAVRARTVEIESANRELLRQVEQRTRAENQLTHLATHDPVTGIPNRALLLERIGSCLSRARRRSTMVAVMLLDLDHFKDVNDTYGHAVGDDLLRAAAARVRASVRECDLVARMGGDEFVVLLEDLTETDDVAVVAKRVLDNCSAPFRLHGLDVHVPPSIGIALFPSDCPDAEGLLKSADLAMYEAKDAGRGTFRYFARDMLASSLEKLHLREQLMHALEAAQFRLHYQPLFDLESGAISSMEALIRWQHPELGIVSPLKFIPAAEKSGQIVPIGAWVLRTACRQLAEWQAQGARSLSIAVNVSAREVQSPDFVALVKNTLAESGIAPERLELELTESAAMRDPEQSIRVLEELDALGVRLAIDDFGAGYSSLMRLKQMPISVLKIDRFFVRDIVDSPDDAAIVRSVVAMAHSLGLTVVAEGVETKEQLALLRNLRWDLSEQTRCDRVQGYLLSKPLTAIDAGSILALEGELRATGS